MPSYRRLQQYALLISFISVLYNAAEGGVSIGLGADSGSKSLIFFGLQSAIEVTSACLVIWRFRNVAKPGEERAAQLSREAIRYEKIATISIGSLLAALALATEAVAIAGLVRHEEPDTSNASLIVSVSALFIMIFIWLPKRYLARALDSSTMKGEATCSLSCIQITLVLFVGSLIFRVWQGGWWVDSATSLVLGVLFGWEGLEQIRWGLDKDFNGGCCRDCDDRAPKTSGAPLQEQYRDICDCCSKREECRNSAECKCGQGVKDPGAEKCCSPRSSSDGRCCTREIIPGLPPPNVGGEEEGPAQPVADPERPASACSCC